MKTILIVDDDPKMLILVKLILTQSGYKVIEASNGKHALETLDDQIPDLIIADLVMPVMDGWQFCSEIRTRSDIPFIPFIFLTGIRHPRIENFSFAFGADEYITKPFQKKKLLDCVKLLLNQNETFQKIGSTEDVHEDRIENLSIPDIPVLIQYLIMSRRSGVLRIFDDDTDGAVYFRNGEIDDVRYGELTGQTAMVELVSLKEGRFEFEIGETNVEKKITDNALNFFIEACQISDEKKV